MRHPKGSATYSTLDPFLHFLPSGYKNLGAPSPSSFFLTHMLCTTLNPLSPSPEDSTSYVDFFSQNSPPFFPPPWCSLLHLSAQIPQKLPDSTSHFQSQGSSSSFTHFTTREGCSHSPPPRHTLPLPSLQGYT